MEVLGMFQFLESLDKMKDLPIVRFFSQFFTENKLAPLLARFHNGLAISSPGALAKEMFIWAIVLAFIVFIVDQVFYWTKPGQIERARGTWLSIASFASDVGRGARSLAVRAKGLVERRGTAHGRR
jgi:hypothetical protein